MKGLPSSGESRRLEPMKRALSGALAVLLLSFCPSAAKTLGGSGLKERWLVKRTVPPAGDSVILTSDRLVPLLLQAERKQTLPGRLTLKVGSEITGQNWRGSSPLTVSFPLLLEAPGANRRGLKLSLLSKPGGQVYATNLAVRASGVAVDHSPNPDLEELHNDLDVLTVGPSRHSAETSFVLGYGLDGTGAAFARLSLTSSVRKGPEPERLWLALKPGKGAISLEMATLCDLRRFEHGVTLSGALLDGRGQVLREEHVLALFP